MERRAFNSTFKARTKPMGKSAAPMQRAPLKKSGKKGDAWSAERASLKLRFARIGITTCEAKDDGCWRDNGLGFAHTKKRRNVTDLSRVALLCNYCHDAVEILPESEMEARIETIISARAIQP